MKQRVLAVVAHPDDEVLGCGGTLRKHADRGDEVYVCFLADGEGSRQQSSGKLEALVTGREQSARKAAEILGVSEVFSHRFPDNRMDSIDLLQIVQAVEQHVSDLRPQVVYSHHAGDVNVDHRLAHQAVVTACRPQPGNQVQALLFFETASSTEWQTSASLMPFVPNWYVDISDTLPAKIEALSAYAEEMRPWPHVRSTEGLKHLAHWRGCSVGVDAAEAFMLGRAIQTKGDWRV